MTSTTKAVVGKHLRAACHDVEAVLQDYTDESVLITDGATYRGIAEIRQFFTALFGTLPKGFFDNLDLLHQEFVGEVGYIHWAAKPRIPMATDTFVVRDGKILFQTFTAYTGEA